MRRTGFTAIGLLTAVMATATATASHEPGSSGPVDFAIGSGLNQFETGGDNHLSVSAHGSGADATGYVSGSGDLQPLGEFTVGGPVTCLRVEGNRATIKYLVEHSNGPAAPPVGSTIEVFVLDNGEPANGQPVDLNGTNLPEPPLDPEHCSDPRLRPLNEFNPIDAGNYTVHDAD